MKNQNCNQGISFKEESLKFSFDSLYPMSFKTLLPPLILILTLFACDETKQKDELNNTTSVPETEATERKEFPENNQKNNQSSKQTTKLQFSPDEKDFLDHFDSLKPGVSFKELKHTFPVVKGIRPEAGNEELASQGLTESLATIQLLNADARLEFNFKNDSLYSYFSVMKEADLDKADDLFLLLQNHYNKLYGVCEQEKVEEENHFVQTCFWKTRNQYWVLTYNINTGTILWGYQENKP